jgi:hypothetical protein
VERAEVSLTSPVKKWLYAWAEADQNWVRVVEPGVTGPQKLTIPLELDTRRLPPGQTAQATLKLQANGGQQFTVPIKLEVAAAPLGVGLRVFGPARLGILSGVLLWLIVLPCDLLGRWWAAHASLTNIAVYSFLFAGIGAVVFAGLLWRRGERKLLPAALLVGAAVGLAAGATLANLALVTEELVRLLLPAAAALPAPVPALLGWCGLGLVLALLLRLGGAGGRDALGQWSALARGLLRRCRLGRLANWLQT